MSCALFTILGMWVLYANKSNAWALEATFSLAGVCLLWACFLAWRDEERRAEKLEAELLALKSSTSIAPVQNIFLPAAPTKPEPPDHNVQCLGVTIQDSTVTIGFQNVLTPGKLVGDFRHARLRVEYRMESTGQEWETIFPARWACYEQGDVQIGIVPQYAFLAGHYHTEKEWYGLNAEDRIRLPIGAWKIRATLIGEGNLSLPPYEGILTLSKDGTATFQSMSD